MFLAEGCDSRNETSVVSDIHAISVFVETEQPAFVQVDICGDEQNFCALEAREYHVKLEPSRINVERNYGKRPSTRDGTWQLELPVHHFFHCRSLWPLALVQNFNFSRGFHWFIFRDLNTKTVTTDATCIQLEAEVHPAYSPVVRRKHTDLRCASPTIDVTLLPASGFMNST
jgi:hypothetical protein